MRGPSLRWEPRFRRRLLKICNSSTFPLRSWWGACKIEFSSAVLEKKVREFNRKAEYWGRKLPNTDYLEERGRRERKRSVSLMPYKAENQLHGRVDSWALPRHLSAPTWLYSEPLRSRLAGVSQEGMWLVHWTQRTDITIWIWMRLPRPPAYSSPIHSTTVNILFNGWWMSCFKNMKDTKIFYLHQK